MDDRRWPVPLFFTGHIVRARSEGKGFKTADKPGTVASNCCRSTLRFLPHPLVLPRSFRDHTRKQSPRHWIPHLYRPDCSISRRGQPRSDRECARKVFLPFLSSESPFILVGIGVATLIPACCRRFLNWQNCHRRVKGLSRA